MCRTNWAYRESIFWHPCDSELINVKLILKVLDRKISQNTVSSRHNYVCLKRNSWNIKNIFYRLNFNHLAVLWPNSHDLTSNLTSDTMANMHNKKWQKRARIQCEIWIVSEEWIENNWVDESMYAPFHLNSKRGCKNPWKLRHVSRSNDMYVRRVRWKHFEEEIVLLATEFLVECMPVGLF